MARQEFKTSVKKAAFLRCSEATGFPVCEECGCMLKKGRYAFDHALADGLGGAPTLENCRVICSGFAGSCHTKKTAVDVEMISDAKRWEAKDQGFYRPSSRPMPGSKASGIKKSMSGRVTRR